jgi:hypothetical protein
MGQVRHNEGPTTSTFLFSTRQGMYLSFIKDSQCIVLFTAAIFSSDDAKAPARIYVSHVAVSSIG